MQSSVAQYVRGGAAMSIPDLTGKTIAELISLQGRNAVITGGARGIGLAIAARLSEAGASVYLADVDASLAETSARSLAAKGYTTASGSVDVADGASIVALADDAILRLGGIDIWVNNAGIYPRHSLLEMSDDAWRRVLDVNLTGTFIGAREAAKRMVAADKGGVIINLASTAGYRAAAGIAHYVATKHGVRGLTKSLAAELGRYNIRVLALAPTLILTPGTLGYGMDRPLVGQVDPAQNYAGKVPLGRAGLPDDVARVALFCASDLSAFMTGSTLPVDAGDLAVGL
jgi:NAD(P)-dependent dehydrogenase (short-subunit alcohol dehydrogenase family)